MSLCLLTVVLATVLVSAPLMVRAAQQGAWERDEARLSAGVLGFTVLTTVVDDQAGRDAPAARVNALARSVDEVGGRLGLRDPVFLAMLGDTVRADGPEGRDRVQIVSRTGAADHLHIVAGTAHGDGVLVPTDLAKTLGVGAGDELPLSTDSLGGKARVTVSGVYQDMTKSVPRYWRAESGLFLPVVGTLGPLQFPPPAVIAPRDVVLDLTRSLPRDLLVKWYFALPPDLQVAQTRHLADTYEELKLQLSDPKVQAATLFQQLGSQPTYRTALPDTLTSVRETVDLLAPPVRAVGIGGAGAALVLVGVWARLRARRRHAELRALVARGLSPTRAGAAAIGEAVLPVLTALAAGGTLGWWLVLLLGPATELPDGTLAVALLALLAAGAAALLTVALVTAGAVMRIGQLDQGPAAQLARRVPWLSVTATITVLAVIRLFTADSSRGSISVLSLVVPLLVVAVVAGVLMRVLQRAAPAANRWVSRLPTWGFLAVRRVLAAPGPTRLMVVTTALAVGLVVYAGALAASTSSTVTAKAAVATGSDVVVDLGTQHALPRSMPDGAMAVGVDHDLSVAPGDGRVDLLTLRPRQAPGVVSWDESFADRSLPDLMHALSDYDGRRVPVIFAGELPPHLLAASHGKLSVTDGYYHVPVKVVAHTDAFPGMSSNQPMLVADRHSFARALHEVDPNLMLSRQIWARGTVHDVLSELAAAGTRAKREVPWAQLSVDSAAEFAHQPALRAQTWALGYLRAIGGAAALLGLVGLAIHAASQQRRRTVAALLLARMGLTRRSADASSALEIGLIGVLAAVVGIGCALPVSTLVLGLLDPVPDLPPSPLFTIPVTTVVAVLAGMLVAVWVSALLVGGAARRTSGGQVLRDAA